jgi:hypothetical protein
MLTDDHRERLELFNEKADKLLGTRFVRDGSKLTISAEQGKPLEVSVDLDAEDVDAFVLTGRFFVQDRDGVSFRTLAKIYDTQEIPAELATHFRAQRDKLNQHLDAPFPLTVDDATWTRREVFDTFLYGGLSHADREKRQLFNRWQALPAPVLAFLESEFAGTLMLLAECVSHVRAVNNALLDT